MTHIMVEIRFEYEVECRKNILHNRRKIRENNGFGVTVSLLLVLICAGFS
jgi:hypothetical protein